MKKTLLTLAMIIGALLPAVQTMADPLGCTIPVTSYHFRDSAKIVKNGYTTYDVKIDMPEYGTISDVARDSVYARIIATDKKVSAGKMPVDIYQDLDRVFKEKAKDFFDLHKKDAVDSEMEEHGLPYYFEMEIRPEAVCSEYITMYFTGYEYWGGAHGMPFEYGVTILTSNGHSLVWDDYSKRPEYMRPIISKHLDPSLFEDPTKIRPLPATNPWLRGDMLVFKYGAYEIAAYAAGMPEAEVHYSKLTEFLTPLVMKLCNTYDDEHEGAGAEDSCGEEAANSLVYNMLTDAGERKVVGQPNIKSFVTAVLDKETLEEGELDMRNGYWEYFQEGDGHIKYNAAYWNRTDGSKLFVISYHTGGIVYTNPQTGAPKHGVTWSSSPWMYYDVKPLEDGDDMQYETGYITYLYDASRKVLTPVYDMSLLGNMDEIQQHRYLILPRQGKDIKVQEGEPRTSNFRYRTLRWDGMKFIDGMKQKE